MQQKIDSKVVKKWEKASQANECRPSRNTWNYFFFEKIEDAMQKTVSSQRFINQ